MFSLTWCVYGYHGRLVNVYYAAWRVLQAVLSQCLLPTSLVLYFQDGTLTSLALRMHRCRLRAHLQLHSLTEVSSGVRLLAETVRRRRRYTDSTAAGGVPVLGLSQGLTAHQTGSPTWGLG